MQIVQFWAAIVLEEQKEYFFRVSTGNDEWSNVVTRGRIVDKIVKDSIDKKKIYVSKTHSRGKAVKM